MGEEDHHDDHGAELAGEDVILEYTRDLRIAAVFIIWVAALIGAGAPLLIKRVHESATASVVRAFSAGVILSLALVHIFPDASEELHEVTEFPVGGGSR
jgi:zinc transporter 1/2/3